MDSHHRILLPKMHIKTGLTVVWHTSFIQHETYSYTPKNEKYMVLLPPFLFHNDCRPVVLSKYLIYTMSIPFYRFLSSVLSSKLTAQWCRLFTFHLFCALITYRLGTSADILDPFQVEMINERGWMLVKKRQFHVTWCIGDNAYT